MGDFIQKQILKNPFSQNKLSLLQIEQIFI